MPSSYKIPVRGRIKYFGRQRSERRGFQCDYSCNPLKKSGDSNDLWEPVIQELKELGDIQLGTESSSLWFIFISGFLGGLLALLTPCVWPMIPLTVSFFLKKGQNRRKSIADAVIYGVSIIVIYLALGMIITLLFGANALNSLSIQCNIQHIIFRITIIYSLSPSSELSN